MAKKSKQKIATTFRCRSCEHSFDFYSKGKYKDTILGKCKKDVHHKLLDHDWCKHHKERTNGE